MDNLVLSYHVSSMDIDDYKTFPLSGCKASMCYLVIDHRLVGWLLEAGKSYVVMFMRTMS